MIPFMGGKKYLHQLDGKNRMRIPAKLREALGDSYYIAIGTGGCLNVYSEEQMQKTKTFLSSVNSYNPQQLKVARYILSTIWHAEEDNQGRILIPDDLREYAKLNKNVKVYDGPNCIEIWAEEVWNEYFADVDLSVLAEAFEQFK